MGTISYLREATYLHAFSRLTPASGNKGDDGGDGGGTVTAMAEVRAEKSMSDTVTLLRRVDEGQGDGRALVHQQHQIPTSSIPSQSSLSSSSSSSSPPPPPSVVKHAASIPNKPNDQDDDTAVVEASLEGLEPVFSIGELDEKTVYVLL